MRVEICIAVRRYQADTDREIQIITQRDTILGNILFSASRFLLI